jgi:hypothetical protein
MRARSTLLSAGSDGYVHQWDVSSGTLPRNARPINKPGFLSHILRSPHKGERLPTIKGMDCQVDNDNDTFIVGEALMAGRGDRPLLVPRGARHSRGVLVS